MLSHCGRTSVQSKDYEIYNGYVETLSTLLGEANRLVLSAAMCE